LLPARDPNRRAAPAGKGAPTSRLLSGFSWRSSIGRSWKPLPASRPNYGFPGNVHELENAVERAYIWCSGELISARDLGAQVLLRRAHPEGSQAAGPGKGAHRKNPSPPSQDADQQNQGGRLLGLIERAFFPQSSQQSRCHCKCEQTSTAGPR
jgi:hypothetical protein